MTTTTVALPTLLRDIHRLRLHLRTLQTELERLPRLVKAHQAKIAKQEQALKEAQEALKHLKVDNSTRELNLKSTTQQLTKHEKQLSEMTAPKEIDAKQKEINAAKALIQKLEEEMLAGIAAIDESTANMPALESALKKARSEFHAFEKESKERQDRLTREVKLAESELKSHETHLPATIRATYDRLVKAHGADALAKVEKSSCGHCHTSVTMQNANEIMQGRFLFCNNCGRALYPAE